MRVGEASSAALGMTVSGAGVRNAPDIERVLMEFAKEPDGGLIVPPSPLTATRRADIIQLAARLRLPAIYPFGFYVASGGLISYGTDQTELVREAAFTWTADMDECCPAHRRRDLLWHAAGWTLLGRAKLVEWLRIKDVVAVADIRRFRS